MKTIVGLVAVIVLLSAMGSANALNFTTTWNPFINNLDYYALYSTTDNVTAFKVNTSLLYVNNITSRDGNITFHSSNGAEKMRLVGSTGNVGIGTTAPVSLLNIYGGVLEIGMSSGDPIVRFDIGGTNEWSIGVDDDDSDKFKVSQGSGLGSGDKFTIQEDGKVGIGTANPTARLNIVGAGGTSSTYALNVTNSTTGTMFLVRDDGYVGIGTTAPGAKLSLQQDGVSWGDGLRIISTSANYWEYIMSGTTDLWLGYNGASRIVFDDEGKVGVNQTSPTHMVHIESLNDDTLRLVGPGATNGEGACLDFGDADMTGICEPEDDNLTIRTGGTDRLKITDNGLVTVLSADTTDRITLSHDNNDGYFKTTDGGFIFITDEGTNTHSILRSKGKGTGRGVFEAYDEDNAEYLSISSAGGLGLITTAGTSPGILHFQNTAEAGIGMFVDAEDGETQELQIWGNRTGSPRTSLQIGVGADAADTASFDGVGNYTFDGNVGVGTTAPINLLHVNGADPILLIKDTETSAGSANITIRLAESGAGGIVDAYYDIVSNGGGLQFIDQFDIGATGTGVRMIIENSGKVGIGTITPLSMLSIRGAGGTSATGSLNITNSTNQTLFLVRDDGNVGIGTASPSTILHLGGASTLTVSDTGNPGNIYFANSNANSIRYASSEFGVYTNQANGINFYTGGSNNRVRIDNSGNVGIGTTNPQNILNVAGDANITGDLYVGYGSTNMTVPDYVFEDDYELMPLKELEEFVKENKHLPKFKSAEETKTLSLIEERNLLLEKIEELTLHAIAQEKRINRLEALLWLN